MQGSETQENGPIPAAGAAPEVGLNRPAAAGRGDSAARGEFSPHQAAAGRVSACREMPKFQLQTKRMINGDQIQGGRNLTKDCNRFW